LAAQEKLTIVTPGILPISYEANGKVTGFGTDLTNEIFSRLKTPIEISIVPSSRALSMIELGTADALFALAKTAEREAFAVYPTEAFIEQPIALYVLKDSPIAFNGDIKTLSGYSIGIIRGGRLSPEFDEAVKNKLFPKLNEVNDYSQNILMLDGKRIDIAIGPRYSILFAAREAGKIGSIKELATPLTKSSPAYLVFSKKGKAAALASQVDATLKAMKKDGTYDKLMQKYFQ
jgi:polar amino acid transport system substrate-binding protein